MKKCKKGIVFKTSVLNRRKNQEGSGKVEKGRECQIEIGSIGEFRLAYMWKSLSPRAVKLPEGIHGELMKQNYKLGDAKTRNEQGVIGFNSHNEKKAQKFKGSEENLIKSEKKVMKFEEKHVKSEENLIKSEEKPTKFDKCLEKIDSFDDFELNSNKFRINIIESDISDSSIWNFTKTKSKIYNITKKPENFPSLNNSKPLLKTSKVNFDISILPLPKPQNIDSVLTYLHYKPKLRSPFRY